jgi:hypothetical protein
MHDFVIIELCYLLNPAFTIFRRYHFSKNIFYYQFYTSQFLILTLKHFTN